MSTYMYTYTLLNIETNAAWYDLSPCPSNLSKKAHFMTVGFKSLMGKVEILIASSKKIERGSLLVQIDFRNWA